MPRYEKLRRGSIEVLLVMVFVLSSVLIPVGVAVIEMIHEQVLLQRAQQYLTETLSGVQMGLDLNQLAEGQPVLDQSRTISWVGLRFRQNLPRMLKNHLILDRVSVYWHPVPYDPEHWMGPEQPTRLPVVRISAVLITRQRHQIAIQDSIELLLD